MRILHTIAQYPDRTGSGIACRNIIKCMRTIDAIEDQALIYAHNPEQQLTDLPCHSYPVDFDTENLPFPVAGMSDVMPYRSTVYKEMTERQVEQWQAAFRQQLDCAVREFKPDLIIAHHLWLLTAMCLDYRIPVIALSHGTDIRQAKQNPDFFHKYVGDLSTLSLVSALSAEQLAELQSVYGLKPKQIFVGGAGFDHELFYRKSEREAGEEVRLLYAGRFARAKGCYELLEAFHAIPEEENVSLHLLSHVEEQDRDFVASYLTKDKRISQYGPLSQAELAREMRKYDIFIFPSYYEGLGLSALEAMASGLYLLTTHLPGLRTFMGETLWFHEDITRVEMPELVDLDQIADDAIPGHVQNLTEAIMAAAHHFREKDYQIADFREELAAFSWQGVAARLAGKAQELLA